MRSNLLEYIAIRTGTLRLDSIFKEENSSPIAVKRLNS